MGISKGVLCIIGCSLTILVGFTQLGGLGLVWGTMVLYVASYYHHFQEEATVQSMFYVFPVSGILFSCGSSKHYASSRHLRLSALWGKTGNLLFFTYSERSIAALFLFKGLYELYGRLLPLPRSHLQLHRVPFDVPALVPLPQSQGPGHRHHHGGVRGRLRTAGPGLHLPREPC